MNRIIAGVLLAVAVLCLPEPLAAQSASAGDEGVTYELRLKDGSRVFGRIAAESQDEVVFETHSGVALTTRRDQIASLRPVDGEVRGGEFLPADPNHTRLFFGPTGRALPRGQVYFGVYEFLLPFVQVGVTDRISVGGGTPLVFFFDEDGFDRPFWLTPKVQVFNGKAVQASVGVFQGFGGGESAGIAYGVVTGGSKMASVTGGVGVAYNSDGDRTVVVMAGGDRQVGRRVKLVTENYVWQSGAGIVSAGVRFFGDRLSADVALGVPVGGDAGGFAFPVVNFVYLF
jgi:hypothetical protein